MSDQNNERNTQKRWVGKVKNLNLSNGSFQQIYLDNINSKNKDGSPNTYFKGVLIWFDQETGKRFLVKQLGFAMPQAGMKPELVQKGFSTFVTIDLSDTYAVEQLD